MNKEKYEDIVKDRKVKQSKDQEIKLQKEKELKEAKREALDKKRKIRKKLEKMNRKKFWVRYENEISIVFFVFLVSLMLYFKFFVREEKELSSYKINDEEYIKKRSDEIRDFYIGINPYFSDKTMENANKMSNSYLNNITLKHCEVSDIELEIPDNYDFRIEHKECSEPVQKQKIDESTSYLLMTLSALKEKKCLYKEKISPSMDYLINCSKKKNRGLKGGISSLTLEFLKEKGTVDSSCWKEEYNGTCPKDDLIADCKKIMIEDQCIISKNELLIKKEIMTNGPVLGMIPYLFDFLLYKGGILYTDIDSEKIDGYQVVKIVGWNKDKENNEYWIVENCFGEEYGNKGYLHIYSKLDDNFFDEVLSFRV